MVFFCKSDAQIRNAEVAEHVAVLGDLVFLRSNRVGLSGQRQLAAEHIKKRDLRIYFLFKNLFILLNGVLRELSLFELRYFEVVFSLFNSLACTTAGFEKAFSIFDIGL